jgi:hypothetical protein
MLLSLLSLPASAHAALPELQAPVLTEVARMAASVVQAGVQPTSAPAVATPVPATPPAAPPDSPGAPAANSAPAPQPAAVARTSPPPAAPVVAATAPSAAESPEGGTSPGTGGVQARAERVTKAAMSSARRSPQQPSRPRAAVPARRNGFALRPEASPAPPLELSQTATRPASLVTALGPLAASASLTGAGTLVTLMLLLGGALLIALMCADAVGVGPRHDYLRRQTTHHRWPPWR